jgi:hypothetical protein
MGVADDHVAVGIKAETPPAFVDQPVMEPAQFDQIGQLVTPAMRTMMDVVHVDEASFPAAGESATPIAGPRSATCRAREAA